VRETAIFLRGFQITVNSLGIMIKISDLLYQCKNGDFKPSFTHVLAEEDHKKLTAEVFLKEDYPTVLFCIYLNDEGEYAGNTLNEAVDEYNKL